MSADPSKPVLVIGSTGYLGSKIVRELRARGRLVRALVRPATDPAHIEADGVEVARGDLLDVDSLVRAMDGVDAVVTSAAGYMKRRKTDSAEADTLGMRNLATAAKKAQVRLVVLTGIVKSELAIKAPHFHHKALAEALMEELEVPFLSIRAGAFIDQAQDMLRDGVRKGRLVWFGSSTVPSTWVLTDDFAKYLAAAVDLPSGTGPRIEVGWTRNLQMRELPELVEKATGKRPSLWMIPWWLLGPALAIVGVFNDNVSDLKGMVDFIQSGRYVIQDLDPQRDAFGEPPTPEDAVARWLG